MPATLARPDGFETEVNFYNLSPDGAQIRYPKTVANKLFGDLKVDREVKISSFILKFVLACDGVEEQVRINVTSVYQHKIDDDRYSMGLKFDESETEMITIINDYLARQLEPAAHEYSADKLAGDVAIDHRVHDEREYSSRQQGDGDESAVGGTLEGQLNGADVRDIELKAELIRIQGSLKVLHELANEIKQRLIKLEKRK